MLDSHEIQVLAKLTWPLGRLGEVIEGLARQSNHKSPLGSVPSRPENLAEGEGTRHWLETAVTPLGLEAKPTRIPYAEVANSLRIIGPALFMLTHTAEPRILALLSGHRDRLSLYTPDRKTHEVALEDVRSILCHELEAPLLSEVDELLETAGVSPRRRNIARTTILRQRLGTAVIAGWVLEPSPGSNFWQQLHIVNVPRQLLAFILAHALQYILFLASWWLIGRGVFQGRIDMGWLLAAALLLLTLVPIRLLVTWLQGMVTVSGGGLLQQRLLYGALRLYPDEISHQGVGQLMGRVFESEVVETLALSGGLLSLMALVELVLAGWVLSQGAGGSSHVVLLLGWLVFTVVLSYRFYQRRYRWTAARRNLTHDLIEKMVGHRTRVSQSAPDQWHKGEDEALANYVTLSSEMDRTSTQLLALVARGWLLVGLVVLLPEFVSGQSTSAEMAISLGGLLGIELALRLLTQGTVNLIGAAIAWEQIAPIFQAATRPQVTGVVGKAMSDWSNNNHEDGQSLLSAHDLRFGYPGRSKAVLRGCNLQIRDGDEILLEGESGSGKSTLAAVLTGLRDPESGSILLRGLDRLTVGDEEWRRRVVSAPQFHENHVLGSTFLFNVLMGRNWPPQYGDMATAMAICTELGLGELIERMPAGILQMVGETGWQLSHGERSRLYIARALMQGADLIILDESLASLDSENLQRTLRCVRERAAALLVIAHV